MGGSFSSPSCSFSVLLMGGMKAAPLETFCPQTLLGPRLGNQGINITNPCLCHLWSNLLFLGFNTVLERNLFYLNKDIFRHGLGGEETWLRHGAERAGGGNGVRNLCKIYESRL